MIVDLKNKQWLLFSLFPLLFWSVLLSNFNYFFLFMAIFGAILTGYKVARDEWFEGMDQLRKSDFSAFDTRFKRTMNNPVFYILTLASIPYGIGSLLFFNYYMFNHMFEMPYYAWMLLFLTWATIFYGVFILIFVPEHWETMKRGAAYGFYNENTGYWIGRGYYCFTQKKYEEALKNFDKALELSSEFLPTLEIKGQTLMKMGRLDDALETFDKGLEIDSKNGQFLYRRGIALRALGRYEESIISFNKTLEIDPGNFKVWGNRGLTFEQMEKNEEAVKCYDMALEIEPKDTKTWAFRGRALIKLERYDDAVKNFDTLLKIDPNNENAWGNKGAALDHLKKYDQEILCYDKALEINPKNAGTWYNRGLSLTKLAKYDEGLKNFDRALEIDPMFTIAKEAREVLQTDLSKEHPNDI
ncbi:MAG TPA: tetratricopeptide repeat protein [Methanoregula sp.]|nr:tetratricopeptide repeat protein [Methanoregula sp.]